MSRRFQFSLARVFASVLFAAIACGLFRLSASPMLPHSRDALLQGLAILFGLAFIGASIGILWRNVMVGAVAVPALTLLALAVRGIFSVLW
ncbi:MAG TPA: hypothetical protein VMV10_17740 [Pirellulales bacterium]|nr:hypothetical protein [Pirellulales bacterium]